MTNDEWWSMHIILLLLYINFDYHNFCAQFQPWYFLSRCAHVELREAKSLYYYHWYLLLLFIQHFDINCWSLHHRHHRHQHRYGKIVPWRFFMFYKHVIIEFCLPTTIAIWCQSGMYIWYRCMDGYIYICMHSATHWPSLHLRCDGRWPLVFKYISMESVRSSHWICCSLSQHKHVLSHIEFTVLHSFSSSPSILSLLWFIWSLCDRHTHTNTPHTIHGIHHSNSYRLNCVVSCTNKLSYYVSAATIFIVDCFFSSLYIIIYIL